MRFLLVPLVAALLSSSAAATSLVPAPGEPGSDAALHALAHDYDRQFHLVNARFGVIE